MELPWPILKGVFERYASGSKETTGACYAKHGYCKGISYGQVKVRAMVNKLLVD